MPSLPKDEWVLRFAATLSRMRPPRCGDEAGDEALAEVVYREASQIEPEAMARIFGGGACPAVDARSPDATRQRS